MSKPWGDYSRDAREPITKSAEELAEQSLAETKARWERERVWRLNLRKGSTMNLTPEEPTAEGRVMTKAVETHGDWLRKSITLGKDNAEVSKTLRARSDQGVGK